MRCAAGVLAAVAVAVSTSAAEKADRVFLNGKVWTGDGGKPYAQALAVRGPRILAVGSTSEIGRHREKTTDVVDLKGRLVVPGFNDAHLHFMSGSLSLERVDLSGAGSVEDMQRRIVDYARGHPDVPWIVGRGWAYGDFPGGLPHKRHLDAVVADRPVWMTGYDGHTGWCNSVALAAAGISRATRDPEHGAIVRDESGEPTGVLKEDAMDLVEGRVPPPSPEEKYRALRKGIQRAVSYGLTSVQNASFDLEDLPVFERVLREGELRLRVYSALPMEPGITEDELARYEDLRRRYSSSHFRFGAVKGFVDGVVEAKTAAMLEPYVGGGTGHAHFTQEELNGAVARYDRQGYQVWLHAIGDRGIRMALDAFEHAARVNPSRTRRHRVEHVEVAHPQDLPRFKALGVVASTQALFALPDKNSLEAYVPVLGPEREARAMAFGSLDAAGAVQAFGSDWPVFSCEVLRGVHAAVTRTTPEGRPVGGWLPVQRLAVEAALRHFTRDAAYAQFEETEKGVLAPGKAADFVVLSQDVLSGPAERILEAEVLLTVMGGNDTHRAAGF